MKEQYRSERPSRSKSQARYVSGSDVDIIIELLLQLRDLTLSRASHAAATNMIVELGGADLMAPDTLT